MVLWEGKQNWQTVKEKREKNQINKIRNEKGEVITENAEVQRIIRDYYEQLYGNKIDNLKEIDRFFRKVQFSKIKPGRNRNYEQPNYKHWNRNCDQKSPKNWKSPPNIFWGKFYQTFREELMAILLRFFQKIAKEGTFPN